MGESKKLFLGEGARFAKSDTPQMKKKERRHLQLLKNCTARYESWANSKTISLQISGRNA